jgi:hypothetical protein
VFNYCLLDILIIVYPETASFLKLKINDHQAQVSPQVQHHEISMGDYKLCAIILKYFYSDL